MQRSTGLLNSSPLRHPTHDQDQLLVPCSTSLLLGSVGAQTDSVSAACSPVVIVRHNVLGTHQSGLVVLFARWGGSGIVRPNVSNTW